MAVVVLDKRIYHVKNFYNYFAHHMILASLKGHRVTTGVRQRYPNIFVIRILVSLAESMIAVFVDTRYRRSICT